MSRSMLGLWPKTESRVCTNLSLRKLRSISGVSRLNFGYAEIVPGSNGDNLPISISIRLSHPGTCDRRISIVYKGGPGHTPERGALVCIILRYLPESNNPSLSLVPIYCWIVLYRGLPGVVIPCPSGIALQFVPLSKNMPNRDDPPIPVNYHASSNRPFAFTGNGLPGRSTGRVNLWAIAKASRNNAFSHSGPYSQYVARTVYRAQTFVRALTWLGTSTRLRWEKSVGMTRRLPQPHARPFPVLLHEDHAGRFEGGAN